jgi:hypothetical protein
MPLSGAAVILFLILPLGVSKSLPFHYDNDQQTIPSLSDKEGIKVRDFSVDRSYNFVSH